MTPPVNPSRGTADPPAGDTRSASGWSAVTERRTARRPLGRLFWVAVAVLPLALTGVVGWTQAPSLEELLAADVRTALRAENLAAVKVSLDGRQVTARVPTGRDPEAAVAVVGSVPGVMAVRTVNVYASAREARACADIDDKLDRATHQQRIPFLGSSTQLTGAGQAMVRQAARLLRSCRAVDAIVGGHVDSSALDPGKASLARARVLVKALVREGVRAGRLAPRGYGDQFEVHDGTTPEARARNDRGSITVEGR
jgi:outer membrane protein OmpA-like peptidoglycan-associated protein